MTDYTFKIAMQKMISVYGEKAYPKARLDLLLKAVEDCDDQEFMNFCDRMIGEEKFAPMIDKFQQFAAKDKAQRMQKHRLNLMGKLEQGKACRYCADDGRLLAKRRSDGTTWAFICPYCESARLNGHYDTLVSPKGEKPLKMAVWGDHNANDFGIIDQYKTIQAAYDSGYDANGEARLD